MAAGPQSEDSPPPGEAASDLRDAVDSYVRAVHGAYLDAGGGQDGRGLAAGRFTVVAAAARSLHLLGTPDDIDVPQHGASDPASVDGLEWEVVFLDPSVAPELGEVEAGPEEAADVQAALGVDTVLYHLVVGQGSTLTSHHAMHTGTGIAHRELEDDDVGDERGGGAPG